MTEGLHALPNLVVIFDVSILVDLKKMLIYNYTFGNYNYNCQRYMKLRDSFHLSYTTPLLLS